MLDVDSRLALPPLEVTVPATSGNCGPGFDALGLALGLRNRATMRLLGLGVARVELSVQGEGSEELSDPASNRFVQVLQAALASRGFADADLVVAQDNAIPLRRGLGSSAAAAAGGAMAGLVLADLLEGVSSSPEELVYEAIDLALPFEGHPDNLVPAILGGLCLSWEGPQGDVELHAMALPDGLTAILCSPALEIASADARRVLPEAVPMADAVFSLRRSALLVVAALEGRLDLLREATRDRLHQPYRIGLLPEMGHAIDAALDAGALAAWVSGSGSTVLALCGGEEEHERTRAAVRAALRCAFEGEGEVQIRETSLDLDGTAVRPAAGGYTPDHGSDTAGSISGAPAAGCGAGRLNDGEDV